MPIVRSTRIKRGMKKVQRRRYPIRRRLPLARPVSSTRTFTETLDAGVINCNAGGEFKVSFDSIPQYQEYAKLYRQFCIKKLTVMLLPLYTQSEINTALGTLDYQATRVAFAVNDTPETFNPTSELEVLQSNGSKVVLGHKKITMSCWPKPDLTMTSVGAIVNSYVAVRQRKALWLNTTATGNAYDGQSITHSGISYWVSNNLANLSVPVFKVYYKVQFALRDPA